MIIDQKNHILYLNNSGRSTFDVCRKKAFYSDVAGAGYGLKEKLAASPLRIGSAVHSVLMQHYAGAPEEFAIAAGLAHYKAIEDDPNVLMTPALADAFNKEVAIVEGFFPSYRQHWMIDDSELGEVIAAEQKIETEVAVITVGGETWSIRVIGTIDLITENADGILVTDHKTLSQYRDAYFDRLQFDHQVTGYAVLAGRYLARGVQKVMYNCIKKPLIRLKANETKPQFLARIHEEYEMDPGKYFKRVPCIRTRDQFDEWDQAMHEVAEDVIACIQANSWRRNMAICDMYSGCSYRNLCVSNLDDDPVNLVHRTAPEEDGEDGGDDGGW